MTPGARAILAFTTTLLLAGALRGADPVLFEPVVGGAAAPAAVKTSASSDAWPAWCGVKILPQTPLPAARPAGQSFYTLIDGERFAGMFELGGARPTWRSSAFPSVPIDLEQARSIGPLQKADAPVETRDAIVLVNGDRLEGFIDSMDAATGVALEVAGAAPDDKSAKQVRRVPMDRIAEIRLATRTRPAQGWRLWLADGSVIDADSWSDQRNQCQLHKPHAVPEMESAMIPWSSVLAIAPNPAAVTALLRCPVKTQAVQGQPSPRLAPPAVESTYTPTAFDAAPMDLHGPGEFRFALPAGAAGGTLVATLTVPPHLRGEVSCRATIECGGTALWQGQLSPASAETALRLPLSGDELLVRLDESRRGAFGCAVRLNGAVVISGSCGSPAPSTTAPTSAPAGSAR
jgi:hypothetical protein